MPLTAKPTTEPVRPRVFALLAALVIAGAALRAYTATLAPMWFDEIYSTWAARGGFAKVLATAAGDVHPPLHGLAVAAWTALGGESTPWLRVLSMLFGLGTIVVVFLLGRALFGRAAGLAAAALLAVHPVHVYFSQEVRAYALLWLALTAAWWLGWRWLEEGRTRHAAGYVVAAAVALYTHYLAGLVLAFAGAAGLLLAWTGPGGRRRALGWIALHVAVGALFAPQLPVFLAQQSRLSADHWLPPANARDLRDWVRHVAGGPTWLVAPLGALVLAAFARPASRRAAAWLAWLAAGPVLLCWWVSVRGAHLFSERYMDYALPALAVLAAGGLVAISERLRGRGAALRLAPWALFALLLFAEARISVMRGPFGEAKDLIPVRAVLRAEARPGDVVYCADTHALLFLAHHEPALVRPRLVWLDGTFPYYEGAVIVPGSLVGGREAFGAPLPPGARWWGLRVRAGGSNGPAVAALFDSAGAGPPRRFGAAALWGPREVPPGASTILPRP